MAALTEAAPSRLVRKLESEPTLGAPWAWSTTADGHTIQTDKDETVTLRPVGGVLRDGEHIACSCLLTPRCLHVLAVAHLLDLDDGSSAQPDAPGDDVDDIFVPAPIDDTALSPAQKAAALALWEAGSALLDHGAANARMTIVAELLRAVHTCRIAGLHRGAAAGLRTAQWIRQLQSASSGFQLEGLSADLHDLLLTSWMLAHADVAPTPSLHAWVGTARRTYALAGGLRLFGLFCEPVIAQSGYGGVAVTLAERSGRMWTLSDVYPAGANRVIGAYLGGISIGDTSLAPTDLCRAGLMLQHAAGSPDGRLSMGKNVRAVTSDAGDWNSETLRPLWEHPLAAQLDRAWQALALPIPERPAGSDLIFLDGHVVGAHDDALIIEAHTGGDEKVLIRCVASVLNEALAYRDNLRLLARAPGLNLRFIGRLDFDQPHQIALLAIANAPQDDAIATSAPSLALPDTWRARVNLGLDRLQTGFITHTEARPTKANLIETDQMPTPLEILRRRLQRLVYGGRMTLRAEITPALEREALQLDHRLLSQGATLLRALAISGLPRGRTWTGEHEVTDPQALARCWLAATVYDEAATRAIMRSRW